MSPNIWRLMAMVLVASMTFGSSEGLVCPGPVEEGSFVSLTCNLGAQKSLVWQLEVAGRLTSVSRCGARTCNNTMSPAFIAEMVRNSEDRDQIDSILTISRVNRNQTKFRCLNQICQLEVYVKPTTPQCRSGGASLGHYGRPFRSFLEIDCTTSSYPQAVCNFTSSLSRDLVASGSPAYTYTPSQNGNIMTRCSYGIFLGGFQTGLHSFRLAMTPELSKPVPSAAVTIENRINIYAPSLSLGPDCPEGVIKAGTTATCTCHMTHPGYPQGWVKWYTSSNRTTGSIFKDDATTITLTYNPQIRCARFECSPESALGRLGPGLSYVPYFEQNPAECN